MTSWDFNEFYQCVAKCVEAHFEVIDKFFDASYSSNVPSRLSCFFLAHVLHQLL